MKDNIIEIGGETDLDIDPNKILKAAMDNLQSVVVLGYDNDNELYMALSTGDMSENILLLEQAKFKLLEDWSNNKDV